MSMRGVADHARRLFHRQQIPVFVKDFQLSDARAGFHLSGLFPACFQPDLQKVPGMQCLCHPLPKAVEPDPLFPEFQAADLLPGQTQTNPQESFHTLPRGFFRHMNF